MKNKIVTIISNILIKFKDCFISFINKILLYEISLVISEPLDYSLN